MTGALRLMMRSAASLGCILLIIPIMLILWQCKARQATRRVMQTAFRFGAWAWGIHVQVQGSLSQSRPLLLVSNHFSYLDLFALGSKVPAAFTPKSEIAGWPLIGVMCKAAGCLFINRRPSSTMQNKAVLDQALREGDILSLFPEGTTNDGTKLLPFKSAFYSIVEGTDMAVQAVSIVYTHLNGKKLDAGSLPEVGWYGEALFFPHVVNFLQQKSLDVTLIFHTPVNGNDFPSRKELAAYTAAQVESGLSSGKTRQRVSAT